MAGTASDAFGFEFTGTERFQVLSRLGAGGMGVVYEVLDRAREERVALKTLRNLSADSLLRFKNEYRALQDLRHPNLVALGEMFESAGEWFFTMELVLGTDFVSWARGASPPLPPAGAPARADPVCGFAQTMGGDLTLFDRPAAVAAAEPAPLPGHCDDGRLRAALAQLARGLGALHRAGMVHRDIKPSNILVRPDGRVVLLDFGLVRSVLAASQSARDLVGTIAYMAPEQAVGKSVGPEADWYSVGVMAYEAITGRLPFLGNPYEVLLAKQQHQVAPPSVVVPEVSRDLDGLCADMLHPDPTVRPACPEVLRRLGALDQASAPSGSWAVPTELSSSPAFVGRARELDELGRAFDESRRQSLAVVVTGPSGVGKSCLFREFTSRLRQRLPAVLVLQGRCHERESIPFKAFDGVVDALSRYLASQPTGTVAALLPAPVALLGQVFPVLRGVPEIARAVLPRESADALEQRGQLFSAVRQLLQRIAERQPVVITIDDLQWADQDSWALLEQVMREPEAPRLLLLATRRTAGVARDQAPLPIEGNVRLHELRPLSVDEAIELTHRLLAPTGQAAGDDLVAAVVRESQGNPLFVDELVRQALTASRPGLPPRLEGALWRRIAALPEQARRLLDQLVVAGTRIPQPVATRAAGLTAAEYARQVSTLCVANLVHTEDGGAVLEVSHDRIREAVLQHLDGPQQRASHERLALAFEAQATPDVQALHTHWQGAGHADKARHFAALSGDQAAGALAFDRAVYFYQLALAGLETSPENRLRLRGRLGEALANGGRGAEAAQAYLEAAREADAASRLALQRLAADQLLRSGRLDEAYAQFASVLEKMSLPFPASDGAAVRMLIVNRSLLALRGPRFRDRTPEEIPSSLLDRVDLTWSLGLGLSWIDPVRGAAYEALSLRLSLRSGDPERVTRALSAWSVRQTLEGAPQRGLRTAERARKLAERVGSPYGDAISTFATGMCAYLGGQFRAAQAHCAAAAAILGTRCAGKVLELTQARVAELWALYYLGEMGELVRRIPLLHREAQERGDLLASACLRTSVLNAALLAADDPDRARRHLGRVMDQWSHLGFHVEHFWELLAGVQIDLYRADPASALRRVAEGWPRLKGSRLLHGQMVRVEWLCCRGRAQLALAARLPLGASERASLVVRASRDARALVGHDARFAQALGELLLAGVAFVKRDEAATLHHTRRAVAGFEALEMGLFAAVARIRLGQVLHSSEGESLVQAADDWMFAQKIRNPPAFARMLAPGFRD